MTDTRHPDKPAYRFAGSLPAALQPLASRRQWVGWDYVWIGDKEKWDKPPLSAHTGRLARGGFNNPANLGTFAQAAATAARLDLAGVGLVLTSDDDLTGVDLDNCISDSGSYSDLAAEIIGYGETYAEISPSGSGLRLFVRGKIEGVVKNDAAGVEVYAAGRYLTVTGRKLQDVPDAINAAPKTLARLMPFAKTEKTKPNSHAHPHAAGSSKGSQATGFFRKVNTSALSHLDSWFPDLFPTAKRQPNGALRVSSETLGGSWQEDLVAHPNGIRYFGSGKGFSPISLVEEFSAHDTPKTAALWLCERMGIEPASLGWKGKASGARPNGNGKHGPDPAGSGQAQGGADAGGPKSNGHAEPNDADESLIAELAALSALKYARRRKEAAKKIGVTLDMLDRLVKEQRKNQDANSTEPPHWDVEPWPEPVDGALPLDEIAGIFSRFAVLPPHAREALALWVAHAWALDCFTCSPFATLISPTMRCGKSRVLAILKWLTPRSELAGSITHAALFRFIESDRPTLLIDEADRTVANNEDLQAVLNSSHKRVAASVIRCDGDDNRPRRFSTWAPKAVATIARLANTLRDRSIIIEMSRKTPDEKISRWNEGDTAELASLRRRLLRWTEDAAGELGRVDPTVPAGLDDRAADNWHALLAIADAAGGPWPARAREAALAISCSRDDDDALPLLLGDIRAIFAEMPQADWIGSTLLAERLAQLDGTPWPEWKRGKPITPAGIARLLRRAGIRPSRNSGTGGRYFEAAFRDAWKRYLPGMG